MDPVVKEVQAFVETNRGHKFLRPVTVSLADDNTFKDQYLGTHQPDKAEVEKATGEMRALGFVPAGFDLTAAENDSWEDVVGFYNFKTKALVVRGTNVSPYAKETLAHELTHALDDQLFKLDRPQVYAARDEQGDSFQALTEGDAVHVQKAYYDAMSPADRASADAEEDRYGNQPQGAQAAPPALGLFGVYPYVEGYGFVDALVKKDGQAGVDRAFNNAPVSSAQVMFPERYVGGNKYKVSMPGASAAITAPKADGVIIDHGVIGQFGLFVMLQRTMGVRLAGLAASTWEGDQYVAWRDGAKTCVRARFLTDSAPDAFPLALVLDAWVQDQGGGTVEEPGTVILTTCR